ncbi:hypothetical protein PENSPDRAFT_689429 [Peniophora sp. CONT]|nr:hypothetical protein PENSPDRAFT_689429 [Peniophora sp. CONT]
MVSTRALIVVATCVYLKRVAEKKAALVASRAVLEAEEDIDSGYNGESATLMEWVDLRSLTEAQASNIPSFDVSETAVAIAFPFPKDSLRLRNAAVCSIYKSDDPPLDDSPTLADVAKSIMDNFWQGAELDRDDDTNSDLGADSNGDLNGEDWDAWTGITRLRNPAPTTTSSIMTLPTLVTPPLSTSSERQHAISSIFRTATSTMESIFNWTCGVAYSRGSGYSKELTQESDEYPLGSVTRMAFSGSLYAQVEDEGENDMDIGLPRPPSESSQLKRPAIAVAAEMIGFNPPRRTGGWMRVDADDFV